MMISETMVFLSKEQCNFYTMGLILKKMAREFVGSVITWALERKTCGILQKSIMLLGLDFMTSDQILNVSLNDFRE
jgi:hypothetical protein